METRTGVRGELFAGARLGFGKRADRSGAVGRATGAEEEEKERRSRRNGACIWEYGDLNDWDGDSCTAEPGTLSGRLAGAQPVRDRGCCPSLWC